MHAHLRVRSTAAAARSSRRTPATGSRSTRRASGSTTCSPREDDLRLTELQLRDRRRDGEGRRARRPARPRGRQGAAVDVGGTHRRASSTAARRGGPSCTAERFIAERRQLRGGGVSLATAGRRSSSGCGRRSSRPARRGFGALRRPAPARRRAAARRLDRRRRHEADRSRARAGACATAAPTSPRTASTTSPRAGPTPLMLLDYVAASEIELEEVAELVEGAAEVCRAAGVALVGGETAELPGIYRDGRARLRRHVRRHRRARRPRRRHRASRAATP